MNFALIALISFNCLSIQTPQDMDVRGYVRQSLIYQRPPSQAESNDLWDNILTARGNLRCYPSRNLTFGLEIKNRLLYGDSVELINNSTSSFNSTYFDWRWEEASHDRTLLISEIDRAWLDAHFNSTQITIGRQRIAWGTNLVWNPTDLFNPASPLDYDNEERPGTDAVRIQWHSSPLSRLEFAAEIQSRQSSNWAMLYRTNIAANDFYLSLGKKSNHPVLGLAWAGQLSGAGLRSESLLNLPKENSPDQKINFTAVLSADFTFPNTLYILTEAMFNSRGVTGNAGGNALLEAYAHSDLSPARWSLYYQLSGSPHPLVNTGISAIVNPSDHSFYTGPSLVMSARTNLDISIIGLIFNGKDGTEFGSSSDMLIIKLKWSF